MNLKLMEYIEKEILPLYERNDKGHNIEHVNNVIKRSTEIIEDNRLDVDNNISYTVAAYHDIGCYYNTELHEKISAEIFMRDKKMEEYFSQEQRMVIKQAIEDHRASSDHEPRNIYGKIITIADKEIFTVEGYIKRAYKSYVTGKKGYTDLTKLQQATKIYTHLVRKFGEDGYAKVWIPDKKYLESLKILRSTLKKKDQFMEQIWEIISE